MGRCSLFAHRHKSGSRVAAAGLTRAFPMPNASPVRRRRTPRTGCFACRHPKDCSARQALRVGNCRHHRPHRQAPVGGPAVLGTRAGLVPAVGDRLEIRPSRQWRRPSLSCRAWCCGACPGENRDQLRRICVVPRHSHLRSHGPRRHVDDLDCSRPQITCYKAQPDRRAVRRRACSAGMGGLRAISKAVSPPRSSGLLTCRWHLFPGAWYRPLTANLTDKRRTNDQGP